MVLVAVLPRVSVTFAVTVMVPDPYNVPVVKLESVELPTDGLVVMEYDFIVEPYFPAAPEIVNLAWDSPYTYRPQPLMTELVLTGVAVTLDMVGTTLLGTVTVNACVDVPSEFPLASSVSSTTLAEPEVEEGITSNHESGMVYDAVVVPATTVCVAVWVPNFHVNL